MSQEPGVRSQEPGASKTLAVLQRCTPTLQEFPELLLETPELLAPGSWLWWPSKMATRKENTLPSIGLRHCRSSPLAVFRSFIYVPSEEQWHGSLLELSGSLPGRLDQVFPPETRLNQPGRAFARRVVLATAAKGSLCKFDFVVFLHPRSSLPSLFPPGVCSSTPCLAGCRRDWRDG